MDLISRHSQSHKHNPRETVCVPQYKGQTSVQYSRLFLFTSRHQFRSWGIRQVMPLYTVLFLSTHSLSLSISFPISTRFHTMDGVDHIRVTVKLQSRLNAAVLLLVSEWEVGESKRATELDNRKRSLFCAREEWSSSIEPSAPLFLRYRSQTNCSSCRQCFRWRFFSGYSLWEHHSRICGIPLFWN